MEENNNLKHNELRVSPGDSEEQSHFASVEEALENLPQENRRVIEQFMTLQQIRFSETNADMAIADKITSEHISDMLDGSREQMRLSFKEKRNKRWFTFGILAITVATIIGIILLLKGNPDVMEKIIGYIVAFAAGTAGGYGFAKRKTEDE